MKDIKHIYIIVVEYLVVEEDANFNKAVINPSYKCDNCNKYCHFSYDSRKAPKMEVRNHFAITKDKNMEFAIFLLIEVTRSAEKMFGISIQAPATTCVAENNCLQI